MNNQLFRKYPSIDFFERFIKIYRLKIAHPENIKIYIN